MNERIKQLAEQAGIGPWGITIDKSTEIFQKFAELIVKECVLQCNEALVPYTGQPSMTHNYAVGLCQDKIKEHFGVEE